MMRLIALLSIIVVASANEATYAKSEKKQISTETALIPVGRFTTSSRRIDNNGRYGNFITTLESECRLALRNELNEIDNKTTLSENLPGSTQYACKKMRLDIETILRPQGALANYVGYVLSYNFDIYVDVHCEPRTLAEKQMYAFSKRCEDNPQPECFKPDMLELINQLTPTVYEYTGYDSACKITSKKLR